ncbi:MAG TPA: lysophospholipid acyltransferase family protein [Gaiellaceae bacterium]|nr:lysophospholipid acyltransferase family protein [Gaiellaceae bacterium]
MNSVEFNWMWGRWVMGGPAALFTRLRVYGKERIPPAGGYVVAFNHFSWIDIPCYGWATNRPFYFLAKAEAHAVPVGGAYLRMFGSFAVRRGESDREAVRRMREVVRNGDLLGIFAEGTRQRSGVPGPVQPGAAMVALNEGVPVIPVAIHGSQYWKWTNFKPVSIVWGEPMRFDGLPAGSKGYREASAQIEAELHRLWEWLREQHAAGRPRAVALP